MDEKLEMLSGMMLSEADLGEVTGGAGATAKHVRIVNCAEFTNVRSTPDSKSDANIIGCAYPGEHYIFYGWKGSWAQIKYGSGKGYIFRDFVQQV